MSTRRRDFLAALAAGCLGPFVGSRLSRAQSSASPPKRLVVLYKPNGVVADEFWPSASATELNFDLGPILAPLERHRDRLLIHRGLSLASANKGPGDPHQRGMGALFTGSSLQAGTMAGDDGDLAGWANGISVDQEVVRRLDPPTLLPSLELGVHATEAEVRARLFYRGPASPLPPINDPRDTFQRLIGGFRADVEDGTAAAQRRMVLQAVQRQHEVLRPRVGISDRDTLDQHAALVQGMVRRLDYGVGDNPQCGPPVEPPSLAFNDDAAIPEVTQLQLDLLVLALTCDITRVASLQLSSGINSARFPWLNSLVGGHDLSHRGNSDLDAQAQVVRRANWYVEQLAYLLDRLASIPEGDGVLLDNTLVLWASEIAVGNTHSRNDIPFLLAGNVGGYFRTGRYLNHGGQPHNRLLISVLQAMGVQTETFGDPDFATGGGLSGLTR